MTDSKQLPSLPELPEGWHWQIKPTYERDGLRVKAQKGGADARWVMRHAWFDAPEGLDHEVLKAADEVLGRILEEGVPPRAQAWVETYT